VGKGKGSHDELIDMADGRCREFVDLLTNVVV